MFDAINKALCKMGIHSWGEWKTEHIDVVTHQPVQFKRICTSCQKKQRGKIISMVIGAVESSEDY